MNDTEHHVDGSYKVVVDIYHISPLHLFNFISVVKLVTRHKISSLNHSVRKVIQVKISYQNIILVKVKRTHTNIN